MKQRPLEYLYNVLNFSFLNSDYLQATIMTDPGTADRTYIGPMTPELVEQILDKASPLSFNIYLQQKSAS